MWALRRASLPLRNRGFSIGTSRACCASSELPTYIQEDPCFVESRKSISDGCLSSKRLFCTIHVPSYFAVDSRSLSSQAGAKSSGAEDDLEDGFSEFETALRSAGIEESVTRDENEVELVCEPELAEDDEEVEPPQHGLELSGTDPRKGGLSPLCVEMMLSPDQFKCVPRGLDEWVEEAERDLDRAEIAHTMLSLRYIPLYRDALEFSEWLEEHKKIEFDERDYAFRVDLIAKVRGLQKAEKFIETIPKSLRGEVIYRTLLANCVAKNVKKAEEVFNKMKDLEFPVTSFTCNQLLLLYKKIDRKKIPDVLRLMEKENVKPTPFTRGLLADMKSKSGVGKERYTVEQARQALLIPKEAEKRKRSISEALAEHAPLITKEAESIAEFNRMVAEFNRKYLKKPREARSSASSVNGGQPPVAFQDVSSQPVSNLYSPISFSDLRETLLKLRKVEIQPNCKNSELRAENEELKVAATLGGKEAELEELRKKCEKQEVEIDRLKAATSGCRVQLQTLKKKLEEEAEARRK